MACNACVYNNVNRAWKRELHELQHSWKCKTLTQPTALYSTGTLVIHFGVMYHCSKIFYLQGNFKRLFEITLTVCRNLDCVISSEFWQFAFLYWVRPDFRGGQQWPREGEWSQRRADADASWRWTERCGAARVCQQAGKRLSPSSDDGTVQVPDKTFLGLSKFP